MASVRQALPLADGTIKWQVRYRIDGRQSSLSLGDKDEADAFAALVDAVGPKRALEAHHIDADRIRGANTGMTVDTWLGIHIKGLTGVEQYTIDKYEAYRANDMTTLGPIPLAALTENDIAAWVRELQDKGKGKNQDKGNSPKTIRNKHGFLSGALAKAVPKHLPTNPAASTRLPRQTSTGNDSDTHDMRMLTPAEFDALLEATTEYWKPMVEFMARSGARWGEIAALKPTDVDRKNGTVRIRRAWKKSSLGHTIGATKTVRSDRTINISTRVLDKLDYSHEWLFTNRTGGPVRYQGFRRRIWDKAVAKSKLDPAPTPHDMRHSCASWMIAGGVPIAIVSRHLGHESIKITMDVYGDVARDSFAQAADALDTMLG
jgi:integrase